MDFPITVIIYHNSLWSNLVTLNAAYSGFGQDQLKLDLKLVVLSKLITIITQIIPQNCTLKFDIDGSYIQHAKYKKAINK